LKASVLNVLIISQYGQYVAQYISFYTFPYDLMKKEKKRKEESYHLEPVVLIQVKKFLLCKSCGRL